MEFVVAVEGDEIGFETLEPGIEGTSGGELVYSGTEAVFVTVCNEFCDDLFALCRVEGPGTFVDQIIHVFIGEEVEVDESARFERTVRVDQDIRDAGFSRDHVEVPVCSPRGVGRRIEHLHVQGDADLLEVGPDRFEGGLERFFLGQDGEGSFILGKAPPRLYE